MTSRSRTTRRLAWLTVAASATLALGALGTGVAAQSPGASGDATALASPDVANAPFLQRLQANAETMVDTSAWKKDGPYTIAALTQGPFNGWGSIFDETISWAAGENPDVASIQVFPSNGDPNQQTADMENAITQAPSAIILTPMSKAALSAPTERAMAAGIPVILCNSGLDTDQYVTEVGRNLYLTGFESAAHLAQMLGGTGNVVLFHGIAGVDTAETWKQAALDAFAQYPGITVVGEANANWSPADSKTAMEGFLAANPQIDGVWTGGSEMAIGAINALKDAGRTMPVFGVTNPQNGFLRLVNENDIQFWGAPYPPSVAKLCLDYAVKVLKGESVPKYNDVIDLWEGVGSIDNATIDTLYRPECTDEYIGPVFLPQEQLVSLGFCS